MQKFPTIIAVGVTATAVVLTSAACSSNKSTTSSTTSSSASSSAASGTSAAPSSSAAAPADYSALVVKASDIPGDTWTAAAPIMNPGGKDGIAVVFSNQGDTREIGDTIFVLPDASAASTAMDGSVAALGSAVTGGTPQSAQIGSGGTVVSGKSPDGSKSVTILLFTEGRAFVTLEFDGAPDDPAPLDGVTAIGQKQDDAIKAGLPA